MLLFFLPKLCIPNSKPLGIFFITSLDSLIFLSPFPFQVCYIPHLSAYEDRFPICNIATLLPSQCAALSNHVCSAPTE